MPSQGSLRPSTPASPDGAHTTPDADVAPGDPTSVGEPTAAGPAGTDGIGNGSDGNGSDAGATAVDGPRPDGAPADGGEAAGEGPAAEEREAPRVRAWIGVLLAVVPFVVSAIAVLAGVGGRYHGFADVALTELLVRDVGRHEVLIGPYSRDGWHHLGPALFYVLAVPYRLLGGIGEGMVIGALLVNAASVAGMALIARRRGGTPLMLCVLLANMLLVRALGWEFLDLAWNPYITVLPYALLVMLTWAMACGERWALPVAVLVTTFVVQTHIGYVALAIPLLGLGTLWLVAGTLLRARAARSAGVGAGDGAGSGVAGDGGHGTDGDGDRNRDGAGVEAATTGGVRTGGAAGRRTGLRGWMRIGWRGTDLGRLAGAGLIALAIGVITWLPPAIEQFKTGTGNASEVYTWFREHSGESRTFTEGWRVVTAQYGLPPEWLAGIYKQNMIAEADYIAFPLVPILLVPVVAAVVLGWRRPGPDGRRLMAVWLFASVIGIVAVARTVGALYAYRLAWAWTLGALAGAYVMWVAWTWAAARWPRAERRVLVPLGVASLVVTSVIASVSAVQAGTPHQRDSALVESIHEQVVEALPPGDGEVLVTATSFTTMGHAIGLVLELERDGVNVSYPLTGAANSQHRFPTAGPKAAELVVASDEGIIAFRERPGYEVIAVAGPMSMEELEVNAAEKAVIDARIAESDLEDAGEPGSQLEQDILRSRELVPVGSMVAVFRRIAA